MNCKGHGRKWSWPILRYSEGILLKSDGKYEKSQSGQPVSQMRFKLNTS